MDKVLGLKIIKESEREDKGSGAKEFSFKVMVAKGKPAKDFITSPQIRKVLAKATPAEQAYFGGISFRYSPKEKELEITKYFPLPQKERYEIVFEMLGTSVLPPKAKRQFVRKGIASMIEARTIELLRKELPEIRTVSHKYPSDPRELQLRKRGLSGEEIYSAGFERYRGTLRRKLAKDLKRARAKRHPIRWLFSKEPVRMRRAQ